MQIIRNLRTLSYDFVAFNTIIYFVLFLGFRVVKNLTFKLIDIEIKLLVIIIIIIAIYRSQIIEEQLAIFLLLLRVVQINIPTLNRKPIYMGNTCDSYGR